MNIVALETVAVPGSLALATDGEVHWQATLGQAEKSAEMLVGRLETGLQRLQWSLPELQLVGVTAGPGSFTGLRVGITVAKILAYAAGCSIAAIDTMLAIAAAMPNPSAAILVVMDAQRRGFLCQRFRAAGSGVPRATGPREIRTAQDILDEPDDVTLVGPGLARLVNQLSQRNVAPRGIMEPSSRNGGEAGLAGRIA